MANYEPEVITTLAGQLDRLERLMPGYGFWYGQLGKDTDLAKMILDNKPLADLKAYVIETYGDDPEEVY